MSGYWEIAYQVYLDGKPIEYINLGRKHTMEIIGVSKKSAYANQFEWEWNKIFPNIPPPKRYRIKLQEIDRTSWGAI